MTDRPGMEIRESGFSGVRDRTEELINTSENIDKVTRLPYETSATRELIASIIKGATRERRAVVFVDGDMDNLKQINDTYDHGHGNQAIRDMVINAREALLGLENAESVFIWRPQAGGDEYRAIVIFSKGTKVSEETTREIANKLRTSLPFKATFKGEDKEVQITSSAGVAFRNFTGEEPPLLFLQLENLEAETKTMLEEEKIAKIEARIEKTIVKGRKLSAQEYLEIIANEWGASRITKKTLMTIGVHLIAKAKQEVLASVGPRRATQ